MSIIFSVSELDYSVKHCNVVSTVTFGRLE